RHLLTVPGLQHAAEPSAVLGGGAGQQGYACGDAPGFGIVAEEDDFHARLEVLFAVFEAAPGDVAAGACRAGPVGGACGGVAVDRLAVEPGDTARQHRGGEQNRWPCPPPACTASLCGCHSLMPGGRTRADAALALP